MSYELHLLIHCSIKNKVQISKALVEKQTIGAPTLKQELFLFFWNKR